LVHFLEIYSKAHIETRFKSNKVGNIGKKCSFIFIT